MNAADLPEGSVVAARYNESEYDDGLDFTPDGAWHITFVRQDSDSLFGVFRWTCGRQHIPTSTVQRALDNGGVVLREGER